VTLHSVDLTIGLSLMTGLDSQKGSAPPLECDLDLGQNWKKWTRRMSHA